MEILLMNRRVSFILSKVSAIARKNPHTHEGFMKFTFISSWQSYGWQPKPAIQQLPLMKPEWEHFLQKHQLKLVLLFGDIILNIQSQILQSQEQESCNHKPKWRNWNGLFLWNSRVRTKCHLKT